MTTECTLKGIITVEINLKGTIKQEESFYNCATTSDIMAIFEKVKETNHEEINHN